MRRLLTTAFLLLLAAPAEGQMLSQEWISPRAVSFELKHPFFDGDDPDFPSIAGFLNARLPVGSIAILGELPFATLSRNDERSRAIGNLMVGVEASRGNVTFNGTLRLPTASDFEPALALGFLGDVNRYEAFIPDLLALRGGVNYRSPRTSGLDYDVGGGVVLLVPTEDDTSDEFTTLLDYGLLLVHRPRAFGLSTGVLGRISLRGSSSDIADRTIHDFRFTVDYTTRNLRPHLGITIPLDDGLRDAVPWILRLGLQVAFR